MNQLLSFSRTVFEKVGLEAEKCLRVNVKLYPRLHGEAQII